MKKAIVVLGVLVLLVACSRKRNVVLTGTYVSQFETEYSKGKDTLVITAVSNHVFTVTRSVTYARVKNGIEGACEYSVEHMNGLLDARQQVIHETRKGLEFLFVVEKGLVIAGNRTYYKIK